MESPAGWPSCSTEQAYLADEGLATAAFLGLRMRRPLFLEGEAGVGKTELAKTLATVLGAPLIRLQCYEGIDAVPGALRLGLRPPAAAPAAAEAARDSDPPRLEAEL